MKKRRCNNKILQAGSVRFKFTLAQAMIIQFHEQLCRKSGVLPYSPNWWLIPIAHKSIPNWYLRQANQI